jgi:hypothetical protein
MYSRDHVWTDADFAELAKPETAPLPAGTEITLENWKTYKNYMSLGMQTLFRGDRFFKILPYQKLVVGPAIPVPLPKRFQALTEKYAGSASIVPAPEIGPGAVTIKGYQGGVPFPNPKEPDLGTKVEYNSWFSYEPAVTHLLADAYLVDRFHDTSPLIVEVVLGRGSYIADPGYPETNPVISDFFRYTEEEVVLPEEARYTGVLDLTHRDPVQFTDLFAYVPSLRRVLRLSSAAVCSPVTGGDGTQDENCNNVGNCQQVPLFESKLLGEKKLLSMVHMNIDATSQHQANYMPLEKYFWDSPADIAAAGFNLPKPSAGNYEARDVYLVALRRIPLLRKGYCYGTRLFYIDKDTWHTISADFWDPEQKYWKGEMYQFSTIPITGTNDVYFANQLNLVLFDFENWHATASFEPHNDVDKAAGKYQDTVRYATPGGLQQINQ